MQMGFVQQHKARLVAEISSLRKQAELYNNPATYVKCAKFQRLANAKEKELSGLQEHNDNSVQDKVDSVLYTAKVSSCMRICWESPGFCSLGSSIRCAAGYSYPIKRLCCT
jgi:hypothetical protein